MPVHGPLCEMGLPSYRLGVSPRWHKLTDSVCLGFADNRCMAQAVRISEIRNQYISELKDFESELSRQLKEVQAELSRLIPALKTRQSSRGSTGKESNKTVSIL